MELALRFHHFYSHAGHRGAGFQVYAQIPGQWQQ